jgi:hypothetical protein
LAIAGAKQASQHGVNTVNWHWRDELALVWAALRTIYPYLLAILALAVVTLAYQIDRGARVQIGGGYDAPYVRNFQERETGPDGIARWRYATDRSRVILPGVGASASTLSITAGPRPDGVARPVQVVVNGIALGQFTPSNGLNDYRFPLQAAQYSYGDLTIDLLSEAQQVRGKGSNTIPFGPQIAGVEVVSAGGMVKPPLAPLIAWFIIAPIGYFLLRRLGVRGIWAAAAALGVLLLSAIGMVAQRLDFALFAPRLAFLLALTYVLLVVTDLVVPRLFARGGVTIAQRDWRLLQLITVTAMLLKLGGILYPQIFIIDQPWHNQNFEKVLQGRFLELYHPAPGGISEIPGQWGIQGQIPYPPFLYVFGLPLYLGPLGRDLSINLWSVLLDCSRPLLIFFLARRLGGSARAGLIAAFAMGMTASTFLLHSWGNYPTTVSQWTALLFLVFLATRFHDLRRPWVFISLLTLLTVTMLLYTVTAVFIGLLLVILIGILALRGNGAERRQLIPLGGLLVGASLIAFFGYYVQYVGPLLTETLPAFGSGLSQGEALGIERDSFGVYALKYLGRLWYYGVLVSLLLTPLGAAKLLRGKHDRLAGPLLASWFAVLALFFVAGSRIDMVDKELWFTVPAIALCTGIACDAILTWLGTRLDPLGSGLRARSATLYSVATRFGAAALGLYLAHLTWIALALWYFRIMVTRHQ